MGVLRRGIPAFLVASLLLALTLGAQDRKKFESKRKPAATRKTVLTALEWLVKNQQKDGSFATELGGTTGRVVTTSFCGLALMAAGPTFYPQVDKAARYVMDHIFEPYDGYGGPQWDQTNWQYAVGGVFLCEYWSVRKVDPRGMLQKLVDEILRRMEPSGGWGHGPHVLNALNYLELEVMSNWMLAALGMASRMKAKVPAEALRQALKFIEDCCEPGQGAVGYSPRKGQKGMECPCRTGGAIFLFGLLRQLQHPLYRRMVEYWRKDVDQSAEGHGSIAMGLLSSALGARQIGPDAWDTFVNRFFQKIIDQQNPDGSFRVLEGKSIKSMGSDGSAGIAYVTGLFTLILQLDQGHLKYLGQRQES